MKTFRKTPSKSPKKLPAEFKSIDTACVPTNSIKLSGRSRTQQRNEVKTNKIPIEHLKEGLPRLAQPKPKHYQQETNNWIIPKSVLTYKATKRILSLATPRVVVPKVSDTISAQGSFQSTVSTKALNYKPTPRILELARPRQYEIVNDIPIMDDTDGNDSIF